MRKSLFIFTSFLLAFSLNARAQVNDSQPQMLRFAREAAAVMEDGTLVPIRTAPASLSMALTLSASGDKANVRIPWQNPIKIVIRVYDTSASPQDSIVAFRMKSKAGKKRTAFLGAFGAKSKDVLTFDADIYDENCLILTFYDLEPGEYGLWLCKERMERNQLGDHQMAFFGVD